MMRLLRKVKHSAKQMHNPSDLLFFFLSVFLIRQSRGAALHRRGDAGDLLNASKNETSDRKDNSTSGLESYLNEQQPLFSRFVPPVE